MEGAISFSFQSELWLFSSSKTTWVFATLDQDLSDRISELAPKIPGFGSVRVEVCVGDSKWKTSLFPSKEKAAYVLPIKRAIRNAEQLELGDTASIVITLEAD